MPPRMGMLLLVGVRGSPERGYFVLASVWSGRWADLGSCSRVGACAFRCFGRKVVSGLSETILFKESSIWLMRTDTFRGKVAWIYLSMDPWIHGCTDPWIHGSMDRWIHGSIHGSMDLCIHGSLYPWIHGSRDPWILGSMDLWIHG